MENKTFLPQKIAGVKISSPEKIILSKGKITKLDILNYYNDISPYILKCLKNRLLSVIRCHNSNHENCFFKKHPANEQNDVNTFDVNGEEYFYISTKTQLIKQVQNGTVEFHIWGSSVLNINKPNLMVFDLDPDEKLSLSSLRKGVMLLKQLLDKLNLKSFLKTSGGKGYHVCVIFKKNFGWQQFADFSRNIAILLEQQHPDLFTTTIKKSARKNKIFIDYLRNKKGATCVAPFSVRARPNAPISMPIAWSELNKISPNEITIKNYKQYLHSSSITKTL